VNQLGVGHHFTNAVNHFGNLAHVGFFGFDPQQVSAVLQAGDAVEDNAIFTGAFLEFEETGLQTLNLEQFALGFNNHVAIVDVVGAADIVAVEEAVVKIAKIARFVGHCDLLGEASAQGVGAGNNNTVVDTELEKGVANSIDFGEKIGMGNGDFTVLVAALFLVGNLVFDLNAAGARFDHFLGQQISGFGVAKTGIDVGNNG